MIEYSLNPLTAVPLVLCDSRALLSSDFNSFFLSMSRQVIDKVCNEEGKFGTSESHILTVACLKAS